MSVCENENWWCPCLDSYIAERFEFECNLGVFEAGGEPPATCDFAIPLKTVAEDPQKWKLLVVEETVYRALMRGNGIGAARSAE